MFQIAFRTLCTLSVGHCAYCLSDTVHTLCPTLCTLSGGYCAHSPEGILGGLRATVQLVNIFYCYSSVPSQVKV